MMATNSPMEIVSVEQQPINLVNRVSEQFLSQGQDVSPMLNAIQELRGTVPGEKYRIINQIVKVKSNNDAEPNDPELDLPAQIQDFVSIKVDIEKKSIDVIIQCLKSEDKSLVTQAFKAKWFFHHTNPVLNVDLFATSIIPYVSEYTRFRIIKALSHCLASLPSKAEEFFIYFVDLCGVKIALPLLSACSEDFIYDEVLRRKLYLPQHMLLTMYKSRRTAVIRYLNLGHKSNKEYEEARKIHSIDLRYYKKFIPHLIRHDIEYFLELVESDWSVRNSLKIGSTQTLLFFKKATNVFLEKPSQFLGLWPIRVVGKKLTRKQYETMYFNLLPNTIESFLSSLSTMIDYLKGYPLEKRYSLISRLFRLKYQKDFVESIENIQLRELNEIYDHLSVELYEKLFIKLFPEKKHFSANTMIDNLSKYPKKKRLNLLLKTYHLKYGEILLDDFEQVRSEKLFELLPSDSKMRLAKRIVELYEVKSTEYYDNYYLLPLSECFPIYKEAIQKSSDANDRIHYIEKMLKSCALYSNMEDLLQVIKYYIARHANEKVDIFKKFLRCIEINFVLKTFGEKHWIAILALFQSLSIRDELRKVGFYDIKPFFEAVAYCMYCNETKIVIDNETKQSILTMFHSLVIDYNIDRSYVDQRWSFSGTYLSVQKACFDAFLQCIPTRYPPEHYSWKQNGSTKKFNLVVAILGAMDEYNDEVKKQSSSKHQKCDIREYPWLFNTTKEVLDSGVRTSWFLKLVKDHSPELYNSFVDAPDFEVDIKLGTAWIQLKKNYSNVMEHWRDYLNQCREQLHHNSKKGGPAARRFLLSTKWYDSLPIRFVEQCLKELNVPGSLKVLAILLDSEVFTSLATALAPKESISTYHEAKDYFTLVKTIPPAINFVNPPPSFDVIIMYCQGNYTQLAVQAFEHTTHLVSKEKIMIFADNLTNRPVSVKKHGIRLLYRISSDNELRLFVINLLEKEKHASVREFICNVSQERLIKSPTDENWRLVQICISALTIQDEACLNLLSNINKMKNKFLQEYVTELIKKVDELTKDPEFPQAIKTKCICTLLSNFTVPLVKRLSEQVILQLLEKYYFDTDSLEISSAAQMFANLVFSERYLRGR